VAKWWSRPPEDRKVVGSNPARNSNIAMLKFVSYFAFFIACIWW
jgi:hypothetical protein